VVTTVTEPAEPDDDYCGCGLSHAALWFGGTILAASAIAFFLYFLLAVL